MIPAWQLLWTRDPARYQPGFCHMSSVSCQNPLAMSSYSKGKIAWIHVRSVYKYTCWGILLIQIMAYHLFGAKPLSEPVLTLCQLWFDLLCSAKSWFNFYASEIISLKFKYNLNYKPWQFQFYIDFILIWHILKGYINDKSSLVQVMACNHLKTSH